MQSDWNRDGNNNILHSKVHLREEDISAQKQTILDLEEKIV